MNNSFVVEESRKAAERLLVETSYADLDDRIEHIYWLALSRSPSDEEAKLIRNFVEANGGSQNPMAWASVIQALYGSIDFRYLH